MAGLRKKAALSTALVGVAIGTGWTADAAFELAQAMMSWTYEPWNMPGAVLDLLWLPQWTPEARKPFVWLLAGIGVLLLSVWTLFGLRHGIIIANADQVPDEGFRGHHTLIMGLSPRHPGGDYATQKACFLGARFQDLALPKADLIRRLGADRATARDPEDAKHFEDLKTLFPIAQNGEPLNHPWQQNLRMIWRHVHGAQHGRGHKLQRIYILPSKNRNPQGKEERDQGSYLCVHEFVEILERKLSQIGRGDISIVVSDQCVDYEDMNETAAALLDLVEDAKEAHKAAAAPGPRRNRRGICVDGTAGQKVFSVAAATVTMNNDLFFGYVDNTGQPKFYDARIEVAGRFGE